MELNGYELSRDWFDFTFMNPEIVRPIHTAIYFFAIEHCNRLGWKDKFGFPSQMAMEAVGVKNWRTYSKALNEIVEWGFIKMVQTSKNQYSSNIIAIVKNTKATTKALDKALSKHKQKQDTKHSQSTVSINKQYNNITKNNKTRNNLLMSEIKISESGHDIFEGDKNLKNYFQIAESFRQLFIKNLEEKNSPTNHQENAKFKSYVDPIRLMIEKDKVTKEQLKVVFSFLQSPEGNFWKSNILSTEKLREKFSQLIMKSKEGSKSKTINRQTEDVIRQNMEPIDTSLVDRIRKTNKSYHE